MTTICPSKINQGYIQLCVEFKKMTEEDAMRHAKILLGIALVMMIIAFVVLHMVKRRRRH